MSSAEHSSDTTDGTDGPDRTRPDRPDQTGPDRTRPDQTGQTGQALTIKKKASIFGGIHFLFYPPYKKRLAPPTGGVRIIERNFVTYCFANMQ